jgi:hypothetical protein
MRDLGGWGKYMLTDVTEGADFVIPEQLRKLPSNAPQTKHYDQIAYIAPEVQDQLELCRAGVFNFYDYVYRKEDEALAEEMDKAYTETREGKKRDERARTTYYNTWRTFQMSDHLPMGIELKINFGKRYLERKLERC